MDLEILDVCFPHSVADKILSRGIEEWDVLQALQADPELGDSQPRVFRRGPGRRGGVIYWALCRVPSSGRYLEVAFEMTQDHIAWCYHALDMRPSARRRYGKAR